jgi:hypothetical protein
MRYEPGGAETPRGDDAGHARSALEDPESTEAQNLGPGNFSNKLLHARDRSATQKYRVDFGINTSRYLNSK